METWKIQMGNACDHINNAFFLCEFIRHKVKSRQADGLPELQRLICDAFKKLEANSDLLRKTFDSMRDRYRRCVNVNGAQVI